MDTAVESIPQPEKNDAPRKGDVFKVMDTPEIRGAGGLMLHHIDEKNGVLSGGEDYLEGGLVRLPVGTKVTVQQVFENEKGVWVVFDYPYSNPIQGEKMLHGCTMVEKFGTYSSKRYMEKASETTSALEQLRMDIQSSQQA